VAGRAGLYVKISEWPAEDFYSLLAIRYSPLPMFAKLPADG
jgi:hypothetical protein